MATNNNARDSSSARGIVVAMLVNMRRTTDGVPVLIEPCSSFHRQSNQFVTLLVAPIPAARVSSTQHLTTARVVGRLDLVVCGWRVEGGVDVWMAMEMGDGDGWMMDVSPTTAGVWWLVVQPCTCYCELNSVHIWCSIPVPVDQFPTRDIEFRRVAEL
jgi:hypothetical protein